MIRSLIKQIKTSLPNSHQNGIDANSWRYMYNERCKGYYPSMRNLSTNLLRKKYTKLAGSFDVAVPTLQREQIKEK